MSLWARTIGRQRPAPDRVPDQAAGTPTAVDLLLGCPFFDAAWYAAVSGCDARPRAAARHYLRHGRRHGLHPSPLFVPDVAVASSRWLAEAADPLLGYLESRAFDTVTHPLFDLASYVGRYPESRQHPWGPLGHYLIEGCRLGLTPNDWYEPHTDQPRGLVDWVVDQQQQWAARRQGQPRSRTRVPPAAPPPAPPMPSHSLVGVVVEALGDEAALLRTVRSVLDQDLAPAGVAVASDDEDHTTQPALDAAVGAGNAVVTAAPDRPAAALNAAARRVAGDYLAFVQAGEIWPPQRLRRLQHAAVVHDAAAVADTLRLRRPGRPDSFAAATGPTGSSGPGGLPIAVETSRLLVSRDAFQQLGGFDESLRGGWETDLACRLTSRVAVRWLEVLGATRDLPLPDPSRGPATRVARAPTWAASALHRHAVDWASLSRRAQCPDVVTVLVTGGDWRQVRGCVARVHAVGAPPGRSIECLVVDDGSDALASQVLSSLEHRFPGTRVVRPAGSAGCLEADRALTQAHGAVVVLLGCDVRVQPGWLAPLLVALERADVLGVQALVVDPSGTVHSAGYAFPADGGAPYDLLQGFPADDAEALATVPMAAVSGEALATRFADLAAVQGLDPLLRSGLAAADLCLRLGDLRPGHVEVAPGARVTQLRPRGHRSSGVSALDRALFADRWAGREPRDAARLWASCGFEATGFDRGSWEPEVRRPVARVTESAPRLRWALKVASPAGERRELWGDTHFARSLARALRGLDQHVVIDHREGFHRPSAHHDDVTLVLRGLEAFRPDPAQVNLAWVISHPELVTGEEAAGFDQVFAASRSWAASASRRWGLDVQPLLQATDPALFHPDRGCPDTGEPVLFVGGSRREFRQMVRDSLAAGLPVSVFGSDWEDFIPAHHIKATHVANHDVGGLYASAGVVLNDHWEDMRREGFLSNRLFDAAASGARVVTDDVTGLDGVFDRSVQVASDPATLTRLVRPESLDIVFGSTADRRAVAARMHREHSFEVRAAQLLTVAERRRRDRPERRPVVQRSAR